MNNATHHGPMTNTISCMVFAVSPWLLLETRLVFESWILLEQMQSDPQLLLETWLIFETRLLWQEIRYTQLCTVTDVDNRHLGRMRFRIISKLLPSGCTDMSDPSASVTCRNPNSSRPTILASTVCWEPASVTSLTTQSLQQRRHSSRFSYLQFTMSCGRLSSLLVHFWAQVSK